MAYCSSLAVYVLNREGSQLFCVASSEKTITSLSWSPRTPHLLAFSALDGLVHVYDVNLDAEVSTSVEQGFIPNDVSWSPHPDDLIAVCGERGLRTRIMYITNGL